MMGAEAKGSGPGDAARIDVNEARHRMQSLAAPLLVLAYEDDGKFKVFGLEGSVPFSVLAARLSALPRDREIILYCA
jgi:rhodanese-related sulfurtransferase